MGACTFITRSQGRNPEEAFQRAVRAAEEKFGEEGFTGSIAEKKDFVLIHDNWESLQTRYTSAIQKMRSFKEQLKSIAPFHFDAWEFQKRLLLEVREYAIPYTHDVPQRKKKALETMTREISRLVKERSVCHPKMTAETIARKLLDLEDSRTEMKFGPAGCIELTKEREEEEKSRHFLFFGISPK
jgi:hypothetical protein